MGGRGTACAAPSGSRFCLPAGRFTAADRRGGHKPRLRLSRSRDAMTCDPGLEGPACPTSPRPLLPPAPRGLRSPRAPLRPRRGSGGFLRPLVCWSSPSPSPRCSGPRSGPGADWWGAMSTTTSSPKRPSSPSDFRPGHFPSGIPWWAMGIPNWPRVRPGPSILPIGRCIAGCRSIRRTTPPSSGTTPGPSWAASGWRDGFVSVSPPPSSPPSSTPTAGSPPGSPSNGPSLAGRGSPGRWGVPKTGCNPPADAGSPRSPWCWPCNCSPVTFCWPSSRS